jgi:hypothetical protein
MRGPGDRRRCRAGERHGLGGLSGRQRVSNGPEHRLGDGGDYSAPVSAPAPGSAAPGGLTISGLLELRLLSGSEPLVRVAAERPGDASALEDVLAPTPLSEAGKQVLADAKKLSEHVYPKPSKKITASYKVGGNFLFLPIGRSPIAAAQGDELLEGNYGVFYDIVLNLENTTGQIDDVRLVFEAAGGMAGAVFEIDGKRSEIPRLAAAAEQTLLTYRMEPGTKKTVRVRTVPLSGSNYPVKLIVRS